MQTSTLLNVTSALAPIDVDNHTMNEQPGSNRHGGEEEETYQKSLELVFEVVLLSIVGIFGIIGNVSAILLFARLHHQLKFHRLMMMLATFDLLYIIMSLLLFTMPQVSLNYKLSGAHFFILPRALPLAQVSLTGSIYATLAITIERYLTVCHPFYTVSHKWSARWYIVPIVTFSVLYNMPKFFELETGLSEANSTSPYTYTIEPTAMRIDPTYIKVYCIWMNFIFMGVVPFCLLIVLNFLTLRYLIQIKSETHSQSKQNEVALAKVSLAIVFVFILCHSVKWIPNLFELARLAWEDKRKWPAWVESTTHVAHFLMTFNSAVNFYIYAVKHFKLVSKFCSTFGGPADEDERDQDRTLMTSMNPTETTKMVANGSNGSAKRNEAKGTAVSLV